MPTQPEIKEMLENTENEWHEDYNDTEINGMKFTSNTAKSKYTFTTA